MQIKGNFEWFLLLHITTLREIGWPTSFAKASFSQFWSTVMPVTGKQGHGFMRLLKTNETFNERYNKQTETYSNVHHVVFYIKFYNFVYLFNFMWHCILEQSTDFRHCSFSVTILQCAVDFLGSTGHNGHLQREKRPLKYFRSFFTLKTSQLEWLFEDLKFNVLIRTIKSFLQLSRIIVPKDPTK